MILKFLRGCSFVSACQWAASEIGLNVLSSHTPGWASSKARAWGQLNLLAILPLVIYTAREKGVGWGGGAEDTFTIRNLCEAHSFCGSLHMSPREDVFFPESCQGFGRKGPALSGRRKRRSGIGWGRLMPLVKWCWHAEGLLWEVVIHHDFRMTQSSTLLLGLWSGNPWLMWGACVRLREERKEAVR